MPRPHIWLKDYKKIRIFNHLSVSDRTWHGLCFALCFAPITGAGPLLNLDYFNFI